MSRLRELVAQLSSAKTMDRCLRHLCRSKQSQAWVQWRAVLMVTSDEDERLLKSMQIMCARVMRSCLNRIANVKAQSAVTQWREVVAWHASIETHRFMASSKMSQTWVHASHRCRRRALFVWATACRAMRLEAASRDAALAHADSATKVHRLAV